MQQFLGNVQNVGEPVQYTIRMTPVQGKNHYLECVDMRDCPQYFGNIVKISPKHEIQRHEHLKNEAPNQHSLFSADATRELLETHFYPKISLRGRAWGRGRFRSAPLGYFRYAGGAGNGRYCAETHSICH